MLDLDELNDEIKRLETNGEMTYQLCNRLAPLYVVRDHLTENNGIDVASVVQDTREDESGEPLDGSEFLNAVKNANINDVLNIIDEHLKAVSVVYPKEYKTVIAKIKQLC